MTARTKAALTAAILILTPTLTLAGGWIADPSSGCKMWNPQPSPGETVSWSGACKDGFAEGKGKLDWLRDGKPYEHDEGEWHSGRQSGDGTQTWPGGGYKGQLEGGMPHGHGALTVGGARYEGAFANGKPDGKGVLTAKSGVFDGTWREGCFNDGSRRASFGAAVHACP
jgi:hypothetical protein